MLRKHCVEAILKKCWFFPKTAEFIGVDIKGEGNSAAKSKFPALMKLIASPPVAAADVLGIVGFFVLPKMDTTFQSKSQPAEKQPQEGSSQLHEVTTDGKRPRQS